jgi:hypothetical protein
MGCSHSGGRRIFDDVDRDHAKDDPPESHEVGKIGSVGVADVVGQCQRGRGVGLVFEAAGVGEALDGLGVGVADGLGVFEVAGLGAGAGAGRVSSWSVPRNPRASDG